MCCIFPMQKRSLVATQHAKKKSHSHTYIYEPNIQSKHTHTHTHMYTHKRARTHTHTCTHAHTHTHTHTRYIFDIGKLSDVGAEPLSMRKRSHAYTHKFANTKHTHFHTHTHTHICTIFSIQENSETLVLSHSVSGKEVTHTCTNPYTQTHTHTHTYLHIYTHIHTCTIFSMQESSETLVLSHSVCEKEVNFPRSGKQLPSSLRTKYELFFFFGSQICNQRQTTAIMLVYKVQGGENPQDALSVQLIFRKRALQMVALLRKETCNFRHPVGLCHPV